MKQTRAAVLLFGQETSHRMQRGDDDDQRVVLIWSSGRLGWSSKNDPDRALQQLVVVGDAYRSDTRRSKNMKIEMLVQVVRMREWLLVSNANFRKKMILLLLLVLGFIAATRHTCTDAHTLIQPELCFVSFWALSLTHKLVNTLLNLWFIHC